MSYKVLDTITKKVSVRLGISESIVSKVMSFERKKVKDSLEDYDIVYSGGLLSFRVRPNRVKFFKRKKREILKALESKEPTPTILRDIEIIKRQLEFLDKKQDYYENKRNTGGVQKPADSQGGDEGEDPGDPQ